MTGTIPTFQHGDAVLVVDPQRDFSPGGSLAVPDGDTVMPVINAWVAAAADAGVPVFVSRDWHPPRTTHFKAYGGIWPPHCVMGTPGAEFHPALHLSAHAEVFSKGMGETEDAYSAFHARDERGVLLPNVIVERGVRHLFVLGLATDYCVRWTGLHAREAGLKVSIVRGGVGAVNLKPDDGDRALEELRGKGAEVL
jgi:nicotinamidase/pyrazinamidase